jgi:hypothetical protein
MVRKAAKNGLETHALENKTPLSPTEPAPRSGSRALGVENAMRKKRPSEEF